LDKNNYLTGKTIKRFMYTNTIKDVYKRGLFWKTFDMRHQKYKKQNAHEQFRTIANSHEYYLHSKQLFRFENSLPSI